MKPHELRSLPFFQRELEEICERFPRSESDIRAVVSGLPNNPDIGKTIPGLKSPIPARKLRVALKAYNLGASDGLRLIYAVHEEKRLVVPPHLYSKKGGYRGEDKVIAVIKKRIKRALAELETDE